MQTREAIAEAWLERILRTYPSQASRFLKNEKDSFRNPAGHAFKEALPILLDELLLGMDKEKIVPALDSIVRVRAVQAFTPSQAVAFVFELKEVLRTSGLDSDVEQIFDRIDQLALMAFDIFQHCREQVYQSRVEETRRRVFVLERQMSGRMKAEAAGEHIEWKERV